MNPINPPQIAIDCLQIILDAITLRDYELFLTVGDSDYKTGITKKMFDSVSSVLTTRMSEGYTITYFGYLVQQDYQIYLWKLSFLDGKDEFVARMAMNGDKVSGILIN